MKVLYEVGFRSTVPWIFLAMLSMTVITSTVSQTSRQSSRIGSTTRQSAVSTSDNIERNVRRYDTFEYNLMQHLTRAVTEDNFVISPTSVKFLLAILYEASAGNTQVELMKVLDLPANKENVRKIYENILKSLKEVSDDYILNFNTRMYIDSEITPITKYQSILKHDYDTDVKPLNFTLANDAKNNINEWVREATRGKIDSLVTEADVYNAVILLLNALFYKGQWTTEFPENGTHRNDFYVTPNKRVLATYMRYTNKFFFYESSKLNAKILRLPYKGDKFAMYLYLPNSRSGLGQLVQDLTPELLKSNMYMLDDVYVDVILPKFNFEYTSRLAPILREMGLNDLFGVNASLPGLARGKGNAPNALLVSNILQKAGIEVDEKGTVAFAATEIQLVNKFGSPDSVFNASHPFMFMIVDEVSDIVLFMGKVENPSSSVGAARPVSEWDANSDSTLGSKPADSYVPARPRPDQNDPDLSQTLSQVFGDIPSTPSFSDNTQIFDFKLLTEMSRATEANVFLSPVSIKALLIMVQEGARGTTAQQIRDVLRLPNRNDEIRNRAHDFLLSLTKQTEGITLRSANKIFHSNDVVPTSEYQNVLNRYYLSDLDTLDFSSPARAAKAVNDWVSSVTGRLIQRVIEPDNLDPDTKLMLLNALYFKGVWKNTFPSEDTQIRCFYERPDVCLKTNTMEILESLNYARIAKLESYAVELPYKDERYVALLLVPIKQDGIGHLLRGLGDTSITEIIKSMDKAEVLLRLPKFRIDFGADLVGILKSLGIRDVFGHKSNLSGITGEDRVLIVDNVFHKSTILVDEEGSVAAAVSGAAIIPLMGSDRPLVQADHPFVFFVYDKEKQLILFEGRVNRPDIIASS